jgi:hypothetical protein
MKEIKIKNSLKLARVDRDLTQHQLADLVGVALLIVGTAISVGIATGNLFVGLGVGFGLITLFGLILVKADSGN